MSEEPSVASRFSSMDDMDFEVEPALQPIGGGDTPAPTDSAYSFFSCQNSALANNANAASPKFDEQRRERNHSGGLLSPSTKESLDRISRMFSNENGDSRSYDRHAEVEYIDAKADLKTLARYTLDFSGFIGTYLHHFPDGLLRRR